jgi:domain of unknown function (DUF1704)
MKRRYNSEGRPLPPYNLQLKELDTQREQTKNYPDVFREKYDELVELSPKVIKTIVPDQASKEKAVDRLIAEDSIPFHQEYPKLAAFSDEDYAEIQEMGNQLMYLTEAMPEPDKVIYRQAVETRLLQTNLIKSMHDYNELSEDAKEAKELVAQRFMQANIELYGEPDKTTYVSLLHEKVASIIQKERSPEADVIFQELLELLPKEVLDSDLSNDRFRPSSETVSWMNRVVHGLYDDMLKHVDLYVEQHEPQLEVSEKGKNVIKIRPEHLQVIFQNILHEEFSVGYQATNDFNNAENAAILDWNVEITDAKSINVDPSAKCVRIPKDRKPMSVNEVKQLVVHELGIHVLTQITGGSTDLDPLAQGLPGYLDTQEGLGKVIEQALEGEYKEAGIDHYITAGLAFFDNKSFNDTYNVKWRLKALEGLQPNEELTQSHVEKAKKWAVNSTMRIYRGTDELPLFKDLCYYNGSKEAWQYLEKIRGDDLQLSLLLAGKMNTSKQHQQIILESRSI